MQFSWSLLLRICFALVWLINGLFCKVLNIVPRHQQIVARVVGHEWAPAATTMIGVLEMGMAFWILSRWKPKACAVSQMVVVAVMNIVEINIASDLLLFGPFNIILAGIFIFVVFYHAFRMKEAKRIYIHSDERKMRK
ncbi:MAG: DoxX-like family protein [Chitinophagaceae bacterium]|nr:DoxX-like family protein [Chitinophagaceae bacterium]